MQHQTTDDGRQTTDCGLRFKTITNESIYRKKDHTLVSYTGKYSIDWIPIRTSFQNTGSSIHVEVGNFSTYSFIGPMAMEGCSNKALVQAENCFEAEASFYDLLTSDGMLRVAGYKLHWIG